LPITIDNYIDKYIDKYIMGPTIYGYIMVVYL
jgi:hypothetical protein